MASFVDDTLVGDGDLAECITDIFTPGLSAYEVMGVSRASSAELNLTTEAVSLSVQVYGFLQDSKA